MKTSDINRIRLAIGTTYLDGRCARRISVRRRRVGGYGSQRHEKQREQDGCGDRFHRVTPWMGLEAKPTVVDKTMHTRRLFCLSQIRRFAAFMYIKRP